MPFVFVCVAVKGMRFLIAKNGACFDIPTEDVKKVLPTGKFENFSCTIEPVRDKLPELQPINAAPQFGGGRGGFARGGGRGGWGGRGGGGARGGGGTPRGRRY